MKFCTLYILSKWREKQGKGIMHSKCKLSSYKWTHECQLAVARDHRDTRASPKQPAVSVSTLPQYSRGCKMANFLGHFPVSTDVETSIISLFTVKIIVLISANMLHKWRVWDNKLPELGQTISKSQYMMNVDPISIVLFDLYKMNLCFAILKY